ncbi:transcriptional regulator [Halorhodospira halophila]|nr:transcriptional regulator [Halorhodospira halophila]
MRQAIHRCGIGPREYAELGRRVGVSKQAARLWVEGQNLPTRENIANLAQVLGVRQAWLEYGEGPMYPVATAEPDSAEYRLCGPPGLDEREARLIVAYRRLDVASQAALEHIIDRMIPRNGAGPDGPHSRDS